MNLLSSHSCSFLLRSYDMRWWIVLILLAYILALRVGSIVALKYWNHLKR